LNKKEKRLDYVITTTAACLNDTPIVPDGLTSETATKSPAKTGSDKLASS